MTDEERAVFEATLPSLAKFKQTFGRDADSGFIAELYTAHAFDLTLSGSVNARGADATDASGKRYQIKCRSPRVQNIDVNNFDFDYIVLVNLDDNYRLGGLWRLTIDQVRTLCANRPKFRKYQLTQVQFKNEASRHGGAMHG